MYAVQAQVHIENKDGWSGSHQVPTFYLDENVQGFLDEDGAKRVARRIIDPMGTLALTITAVKTF
jgi:hypothetical protein